MRLLKRGVTLLLVLAMFICTSSVSTAAGDAPAGLADITDAEVTRLVKEGFDKFYNQSAIGLALVQNNDTFKFYAYDSTNGIGAHAVDLSYEEYWPRDISLDIPLLNWIDLNDGKEYYPEYNSLGDLVYRFYPQNKENMEEYIEDIYGYVYTIKKEGFILADEYQYAGNSWEYGPTGERHLCYIAEVPDTDKSLYLDGPLYLPKTIYIGADDGMIYRIDEEYYSLEAGSSNTKFYQSTLYYPQSLSIPDDVRKSAILSDVYDLSKSNISYAEQESTLKPGSFIMQATGVKDGFNSKSLKLPSSVKVLGKTYKIEGILQYAFKDCSFETADTGDNVREIGVSAFAGCKKLKKITIGKSIKDIGKKAFKGCKKLKTIIIKDKKMRKYVASSKGRKALGIDKRVVIK